MIFNDIWTKELNDELRQMNKDGKSVDEIRERFGKLLEHNPKKKYCCYDKLLRFDKFVNEIYVNPRYTRYLIGKKLSVSYNNEYDYFLSFRTNKEEYYLILFYYIDKGIKSYNLLFTTTNQYNEYEDKMQDIIKSKKHGEIFTENDMSVLSKILERETKLNEPLEIMNSISYILFDFCPRENIKSLSIGDTNRKEKINMYRDIIKNSFPNIIETISVDEKGKDIYYYSI